RRSLSYRKSFQHEAEGHPGCNVRTLPVPRTKPAPVSRWSPPTKQRKAAGKIVHWRPKATAMQQHVAPLPRAMNPFTLFTGIHRRNKREYCRSNGKRITTEAEGQLRSRVLRWRRGSRHAPRKGRPPALMKKTGL
ncbi:MAG: hypothetical protein LBQ54_08240, partial [Planctomycetaceae bacterium]|nr:hypothetical protein [Planctomycetaceae bacterium]